MEQPPSQDNALNPAHWALHHRVLVNLAVLLILVSGCYAFATLPREIFPAFSLQKLSINTVYPGASPSEVELSVTAPIEVALSDLQGIDEITSESLEGQSRIQLDLLDSAPPMGRMLDDVQAAIDGIEDLPEDVEESRIQEIETRFPVITASLFGDLSPHVLKDLADDIADDLREIEGVAQVTRSGVPERVIWVELDEIKLRQYRLTPEEIERVLRARNLTAPAGNLRTENGELLIRSLGEVKSAAELAEIPLLSGWEGRSLRLGNVARLREGFEDPPTTLGFVEGQPAFNLTVFKNENGDAIGIAERVNAYCEEHRYDLPAGVDLKTHGDLSVYISNRIRTMNSTAALALGLVLACLYLFLSGRIAFLAAIGIPVAFLGAAALLKFQGNSLSMVGMFAFIIVLGMVVDDAIVLCENIYRHLEEGKSPWQAALVGTREVAGPVVCTVATTIAAFLPMLMISGDIGKYLGIIPIVASLTLVFSLFEALFAMPVHIVELMSVAPMKKGSRAPLAGLLDFMRVHYQTLVRPLLGLRYLVLTILLCGSALLALFGVTRLPFELFGEMETKQFFLNMEAAPSTPIHQMSARMQPVQEIVGKLPRTEVESFNANIGIIFDDVARFKLGSYRGQVFVDLWEGAGRERDSETIINDLRQQIGQLPGFRSVQILRPQAGPSVPAIEIGVIGEDYPQLRRVSAQLQESLRTLEGVRDIRDDYEPGKLEVQVRLTEQAERMGLTVAELNRQLQGRFLYAEATEIHRAKEAPEVRLRLQEDQRRHEAHLFHTWVELASGDLVPFSSIARIERRQGPARIARSNQKRAVTVLADVDRKLTTPDIVMASLAPEMEVLQLENPEVQLRQKGESLEMQRSVQDLVRAMALALAIIYILLAALFRSYFQPLVVISVLPFAVNGVFLGHLIQDQSLSILSLLGLLALAGIVVNDSLVLVSFVNELRRQGRSPLQAVLEGGAVRVRPILLTSITTIIGLVPLAFFSTGQAKFLAPMAISMVWGLVVATLLTLIVVPCFYLVYEDCRSLARRGLRLLGLVESSATVEQP